MSFPASSWVLQLLSNGGCECSVGLPKIGGPCGRVGINSGEADAGLVMSIDVVIGVAVDVSGSLGRFSSYEVRVSVSNQGDRKMVESILIR